MKKKIAGFGVCIILLCNYMFSLNAYAADKIYTEQGEKLIGYLQTNYPSLLQTNNNYEYIQFLNDFNSSWGSLYFLHMLDFFSGTGTAPDEEKYKEVLLNIIETHDLNEAGDIANQKKLDNLKTFADYGKDTIKMGKDAVSLMAEFSSSTSDLEKNLLMAVDGLSVLDDTTENWIDALSNLETSVQNYSYYSEFLQIIEENAEGDLKNAAASLRKNLEEGMKLRLEDYTDITNENIEKWGEEFFSDVLFETCKLSETYETDDTVKWFVDSGQNLAEKLDGLKESWELGKSIGILIGDLTVGGENLIDRLHETMAVKEIGQVLSENLQDMVIEELDEAIGTKQELYFVQKYVMQSKFLINCRVRGEYCWYSIIASDAGLLSFFNKETGEKAQKIYSDLVDIMEEIDAELDQLIKGNVIESGNSVFEDLPEQFEFSSGAGGWMTSLQLNLDGSFTGQYYDANMGETGAKYPKGTVHICNFTGRFAEPKQIDTYTYSMHLESLELEKTPGEIYYEDNIKYICESPYGFDNANEFTIYLPGAEMSELPQGFLQWIYYQYGNDESIKTLPYYGIYNVNSELAFLADK